MASQQDVKIFAGRASHYLGEQVAASFGTKLGKANVTSFSDGEFTAAFEETVREKHVFLVQSTFAPTENLFELLLLADAAKRASAKSIVAVIPYFGFARQDRKDQPRVAIGSKMVANMLTASGITRLITMDLHADQIQGFFEFPVDHLYASTIFLPYIQSLNLSNLMVAAPDTGGTKRANSYAKFFDVEMAICYKQRKKANVIDSMQLIGDVSGKDVLLIDDIIDTAGTLTTAANMIMDSGANSVRAVITHPVLSGKAYERIEDSALTELIVTNTIPLKHKSEKIKVLTVADLFADIIQRIISHESISSHFLI